MKMKGPFQATKQNASLVPSKPGVLMFGDGNHHVFFVQAEDHNLSKAINQVLIKISAEGMSRADRLTVSGILIRGVNRRHIRWPPR